MCVCILISAIIAQIRNNRMQITSERSATMTRVNDGGETTECRKVLGVSWDHRQTARKITRAVCRCNGAAGRCHDSAQINAKALLESPS